MLTIPRRPARSLWPCFVLTWLALSALALTAAPPYTPAPGPRTVQTLREEWQDAARQRAVPVKVYYPAGTDRCPVIVFSHGLGGTRDGYEYLGHHWASHGYVVVHLQHLGSDDAVWRGQADPMAAMKGAAANPVNALHRPRDVSFALDRLTTLDATTPPLQGRLDLQRSGVAGHSFGAYTTLAIAGQSGMGGRLSLADARVKAAIPMSAPVPAGARRDLDSAYGTIRIPCLHMTGTRDSSPIGDTTIAQRRLPYDHSRNSDQYLLTFTGGDHMVFSGRPRQAGGGEQDELFQGHIRGVSLAFWDAYLRGDAAAKAWLGKDFATTLGQHGTWEQRLLAPAAP